MSGALDESCIDRSRAARILQTGPIVNQAKVLGVVDDETLAFYRALGDDLVAAEGSGRISLEPSVVRQQVLEMRLLRTSDKPPVSKEIALLLRALLTEVDKRGGAKDLDIISLYRPGDEKGPHLAGRAIDIRSYAGKRINAAFPDEAALGATACFRDMAANANELKFKYAFGLPRNLRTDNPGIEAELKGRGWEIRSAIYAAALNQGSRLNFVNKSAADTLLIYDAIRSAYKFTDVFFQHSARPNNSPTGSVKSDIAAFVRTSLRSEWLDILSNGGNGLRYMFPDATDHLHIEVV